MNVTMYFIII